MKSESGISIDVVKYSDMPNKQWYMSPHHTSWYYHHPRILPSEELSPKFLEATLDPPLRLLALGLNSLGYTTLPSCSGHYKDEEELDESYNFLIHDSKLIRGRGLELQDVENGNTLVLKNPSWCLPWDRATFRKIASGTAGKPEGYLGFNVPKAKGYEVGKSVDRATKNNDGCRYEVKKMPNGYTFELRVHTGKQRSQDKAWEKFGDDLIEELIK